MRRFAETWAAGLALLALSAAGFGAQQRVATALQPAPPAGAAPAPPAAGESYRLGPNDSVTIRCLNAAELGEAPIRIDTDGQITVPMAGRVQAAGRTVRELEAEIKTRLAVYILDPQVVVRLIEARSQPVSVIGAVNHPGVVQLEGERRLLEVLSLAGGLRQDAGQILTLTRRIGQGAIPLASARADAGGAYSVADIDLKSLMAGTHPELNLAIRPFDVLSVPMAELIYVVGEVRRPGGFTLAHPESISVLQALSLAEGLQTLASAKNARIIRQTGTSARVEVPVDLPRLLAGETQDLPMQAGDILFVPRNKAKTAGLRVLDAIVQTGSGMMIYRRW